MGSRVTLFPRYKGQENRTTNYCLLTLKALYEESPLLLSEVVAQLLGEQVGAQIGVAFEQQERTGASVPDGAIRQSPLLVQMETKVGDGFDEHQLRAHIEALGAFEGTKALLAVGNLEHEPRYYEARMPEAIKAAKARGVLFSIVSFEDLTVALDGAPLTPKLRDLVQDFHAYLDAEQLLATWKTQLDVVNCAALPEDINDRSAYMCPATNGVYNHHRCLYFGMYRDKRVEKVAIIRAVIDLQSSGRTVRWINVAEDGEALEREAMDVASSAGRPPDTRVFLLGPRHDTEFAKDSRGGLWGPKTYFDLSGLPPIRDARHLADELRGKKWSQFGR